MRSSGGCTGNPFKLTMPLQTQLPSSVSIATLFGMMRINEQHRHSIKTPCIYVIACLLPHQQDKYAPHCGKGTPHCI